MRPTLPVFFLLFLCCLWQQSPLQAQGNFALLNGCITDATVFVAFTEETEISTCAGDGEPDRIRFATSTLAQSFAYVVVDENDTIVSIGFSNFIDFEMLPLGTLRVYAFSTLGFITAQVGEDFNTAQLSEPCFGLTTNFVTVNNGSPGGSTISTTSGQDTLSVCAGDGLADLISFTSDSDAPNVAFVVTDTANIVLAVNTSGTIDFEGAGGGICYVWSVGYTNAIPVEPGDVLAAGNGCNGVSDNFIVVDRNSLAGASVLTADSSQVITTCPADGQDDFIDFIILDGGGTQTLVVTDDQGNILGLPGGLSVNFEDAGAGDCRVYVLTYEGDLLAEADDNVNTDTLADGCYALSAEFVTVQRIPTEGGTVRTIDDRDTVAVCPGDGGDNSVLFVSEDASGGDFIFVITDDNNVILGLSEDPNIDFDEAGFGTCRVWGLSYRGDILAGQGDNAAEVTLASECFDLSDNFVTILREEVDGGTISLEGGGDEIEICPEDELEDIISFVVSGNSGPSLALLVTDENNEVLGFVDGPEVDFDSVGFGTCRVWALSYSGFIVTMVGDDATSDELATGCFDLSDNFVSVIRELPEGGSISTDGGLESIVTCPGDGLADEFTFEVSGNSGPNFTLVVTDDSGNIIGVPPGLTIDFEDAGGGTCRVYGLTYFGDLLAAQGVSIDAPLAAGCFALTDNLVSVERIATEGGTVRTIDNRDTVSVCPGDGGDNSILFVSEDASGGEFIFVVTDDNNEILGLSEDSNIDFDDASLGTCRVWGLSYRGDLLAEIGDNAAITQLASDCFDLSDNFVTVLREDADGGTISLEDGSTEVELCPGDGIPDLLTFVASGNTGPSYVLLVTDENNMVLGFVDPPSIDFDNVGQGTCRVWGLSYSGNVVTVVGDDAETDELATGCFDLSDNFVTVIRNSPEGGILDNEFGLDTITTCPNDGNEDLVTFSVMGNTAPNFSLIVTDNDGVVIGTPAGLTVDFDQADSGVCRVYGVAYEGALLAAMGDQINTDALAEGCYALTDNFITIIREEPDGGTVSTEDGDNSILICPNNGTPDIVRFDSTGNAELANFVYVVTDVNNVIMFFLFGDSFNFDGSGQGVCRVWGLPYDGTLTGAIGEVANEVTLATGCHALSDNFITVVRQIPVGGTVSTEAGETEIFLCPGDGVADVVDFQVDGAGGGAFTFIVTDDENNILLVPDGNTVDFEDAGLGVCRLWGLSYQDTLLAAPGLNASEQLATGCFTLSDNFVTVTRDVAIGGTVSLPDGSTNITTCPGDGIPDIVNFESEGAMGQNFVYLITDDENVILEVTPLNEADFEDAGFGVCRVWGLSYAGDLLAQPGDTASIATLADGCFGLSDNFIEVLRVVPEGGTISSPAGTTIDVCAGDGIADSVEFVPMDQLGSYTLIAAQGDLVVGLLPDLIFNFENAAAGTYQIYGLSYAGALTVGPGTMLSDDLATSCFDLTDNFITVNVTVVDGGTISVDGIEDVIYLCPTNINANIIDFETTGLLSDTTYRYIIGLDNGISIVELEPGVTDFDFNGFPLVRAKIFGVNYTGDWIVSGSYPIETTQLSDGCFALSDNCLLIISDAPEAGEISVDDTLFCAINGNQDLVVNVNTTSEAGYAIVVTDENDIVQLVSLDAAAVPLGTLPEGDYRLYGLSYTGNVTVSVGDDINMVALADNCFEVTADFVTVTRGAELDGGILSTLDGLDTFYVCPQDGIPDVVGILTTVTDVPYRFAVTDNEGNILIPAAVSPVFNFDTQDPGICRIYGYALTGDPIAFFGQNINEVPLSNECFALSENFITIIREEPAGGTVATVDGETEVTIDLGSGNTSVEVVSSDASQANFIYVITDDQNVILDLGDGPVFDFGDTPAGVCRIWGLSYTGEIIAMPGDTASAVAITDNCWSLSDNFVTVTREEARPGMVADPAEVQITPYPNPVSGDLLRVIIESEDQLDEGNAFVRDQHGRAWATERVAGGTNRAIVDFDISTLPSGLFMVQYQSEGRLRAVRFIRQ
ncbi:MAG: T9SS type A sorting domain-containing protein [Bacteroidota bacterium]